MRVLQVVTDRDRRGAQVFALDLQDGLAALGSTISSVALEPGQQDDLLPIEALGPSRRSWQTLRTLRRRSRNADIVIAHGSATLLACALALAFTRTPFVYRQISDPRFWAGTWARRLRVALMIRRAAGVVALSESSATALRQHYWLASGSSTVIPNAVPGMRFHPARASERDAARDHFGLGANDSIVTFVGALVPEKGVETMIACAAANEGTTTLIVGDGSDRQRLEDLAARACPSRVLFVGATTDVLRCLLASDLVALPSRGGDSMPAVLIEAGLCGLPVVATPVGAIPDVVVEGETGRLVPIGDDAAFGRAIRELVDDPARRASMGAAARERCAAQFTIDVVAPSWHQLLARTLGTATAEESPTPR